MHSLGFRACSALYLLRLLTKYSCHQISALARGVGNERGGFTKYCFIGMSTVELPYEFIGVSESALLQCVPFDRDLAAQLCSILRGQIKM